MDVKVFSCNIQMKMDDKWEYTPIFENLHVVIGGG